MVATGGASEQHRSCSAHRVDGYALPDRVQIGRRTAIVFGERQYGRELGSTSRVADRGVPVLKGIAEGCNWRWRRGDAGRQSPAYFDCFETVRYVELGERYAVKARGLADRRGVESAAAAFAAGCTKGYGC